MSYDVWFKIDAGGPEPVSIGGSYNYTRNCWPMFDLALGEEGDTAGMWRLRGMTCGDAIPLLEKAVAHMADPANDATYRAMNPPNGWGDHEGATRFLRAILEECRQHPRAVIDGWY